MTSENLSSKRASGDEMLSDLTIKRTGKSLLQRSDWIKAGLIELAKSGPEAVGIASLARLLGVTKGSFYWHFASRDELLKAILDEWKSRATNRVIEIVEAEETTAEAKIRKLAVLGVSSSLDELGGSIELAVRSLARTNKEVSAVVAEVDKQRIAYLINLFKSARPDQDPELLACLHACFSAGLRQTFAYSNKEKLRIRQDALDKIFFPPADKK